MSDGNKFWPSLKHLHVASDNVLMEIETRCRGTIPDIIPAQDVFVVRDGHLVIDNPCKPHRNPYG